MEKGLLKSIAIACAAVIVVLVLLNADYFGKNVQYSFSNTPKDSATSTQQQLGLNQITIPSLGITAPIVETDSVSEKAFQKALAQGVAHYPGTAFPGQPGNAFLFGHSSDFPWKDGDYKTVFALLPRIALGAEVFVSDKQGNEFTYIVTESFVAESKDVHLLQPPADPTEYRLTLQTSYPLGTAWKRWIVISKLKN